MKILVIGSGGQLGRSLCDLLCNHRIVPLTHRDLDIVNLSAVTKAVESFKPDTVINAAAFNDVDGAESRADEAYRTNALGPRNLAIATARIGSRLLHVSTDYVFDGTLTRPYHEYDSPHPLSTYGSSKLAGEDAVREMNPRHYIVRTAWLFDSTGNNFLNRTRILAASRERFALVSDQFGSPTHVAHLAKAIGTLIDTDVYGNYHLAGRGGTSRFELVKLAFELLAIRVELEPVAANSFPAAAQRPAYSVLTTIQEPRIELPSWQEGVEDFARACGRG